MKDTGELRATSWEPKEEDGEMIVRKFARLLRGVVMIGVYVASVAELKSTFLIFIPNWVVSNKDQGVEKHPPDAFC